MFRLGDLVVYKCYSKDVRLIVSISDNYYKLKMLECSIPNDTNIYIPHHMECWYEKVGNIFDKLDKNTCI